MVKEINEEKISEIINSKLLEWKDSKDICSIQFEEVEYYMKENSNEWEIISECYQRIPTNNFEEIMEVSIVHSSHINCFINTRLNIKSEIVINSSLVYLEFNMEGHKIILRIESLKKK